MILTGSSRSSRPRQQGVEYGLDHAGDWFWIIHNDAAENFELVRAPVATPGKAHWTTVIAASRRHPHRRRRCVPRPPGGGAAPGRHDRHPRRAARRPMSRTRVTTSSSPRRSGLSGSVRTRSSTATTLRLGYTSLVTPGSVYDYDIDERALTLLRRSPVLGGVDLDAYESTREWARGRGRHPDPDLRGLATWDCLATGRRRSCSTATARTRRRWTRGSRSRGCRCSTAASASRWRTSVAAARWAAGGTRTGSCSRSDRRSPTFSPAQTASSRPVGPRPTGSSRAVAAPAGCSWARWPTSRRRSSQRSSPRCRSSTR